MVNEKVTGVSPATVAVAVYEPAAGLAVNAVDATPAEFVSTDGLCRVPPGTLVRRAAVSGPGAENATEIPGNGLPSASFTVTESGVNMVSVRADCGVVLALAVTVAGTEVLVSRNVAVPEFGVVAVTT